MSTDAAGGDSTAAANDISKEEILRHIFGEIGELIEDFTCAVESTVLLHGRMYITNKFICFYSNLFGLEKKIRIPYSHIKNITKENTAKIIPNAIAISTDKKDYLFRSFWDREECFRILTAFVTKFKGIGVIESNAKVFSDDGLLTTEVVSAPVASPAVIADYFPDKNSKVSKDKEPVTDPAEKRSSVRVSASSHANFNANDVLDTESGAGGEVELSTPNPSNDLSLLMEAEVAKARLKLPVLTDTLELSLKDFVSLFLADGAAYGIKKYHESVKDTNLVLSAWTELSPVLGQGREMKFFKPVNLPGLASTRGVKVQRMKRFEDLGLIVCSCTRLEDVPAADTFSVDDVLTVKVLSPTTLQVEITFQVTFIKSTMMKYIIEKSTNGEMLKWLEAFCAHLKKISILFKEGKLETISGPTDDETEVANVASPSVSPIAAPSIEAPSETQKLPKGGSRGPLAQALQLVENLQEFALKFNNESLGDRVRVTVILAVLLFFLFLHWKWGGAVHKIQALEAKVADLERTVSLFLDRIGPLPLPLRTAN